MPTPRPIPRGLYLITDGPRPDLMEVVSQALQGGARLVQYRDKTRDTLRRHQEALALRQLCADADVPLIINDDIALALAVGANGVHLGEDDDDIATARAALGSAAIIGVSCYDQFDRAKRLVAKGAGYVAFGAFFASPTKPLARRASLTLLRQSATLGVPRVAIGGITPDNGADLIAAGADCLAVISAVCGAPDVRAAAQRFSDLFAPTTA